VERRLWNTAHPLSRLRDILKFDPDPILDSANPAELIEQLLTLPDPECDRLIERLELEKRFPDAKP